MELTTVLQDPGIWIAASKEVTAHAELTVDFDFLALSGAQEVTMTVCLSIKVISCLEHSILHLSLLSLTQVSLRFLSAYFIRKMEPNILCLVYSSFKLKY